MTLKCSIPGCRGNYDRNGVKVRAYRFPRDDAMREKWISLIPKKDFRCYKYSMVCELHFEKDAIAWETSAYDEKTGRTITAPLRVPRVKNGAFPTIFPEPPMYSSVNATKPREDPSKKRKKPEKSAGKKKIKKLQDPGKNRAKKLNKNISTAPEPTEIAGYIIIKEEPDIYDDNPSTSTNGCVIIQEEAMPKKNSAPFSTNATSETSPSVDFVFSVADYAVDSSPNVREGVSISSIPKAPITNRKDSFDKSVENVPGNKAEAHQLASHSVPPINSKDELVVNALSSDNLESMMGSSEESSPISAKTNERSRDLFDAFGEYIAGKLRQLDWRSCAYALKAIADIIFKAETKNFNDADVS